MDWLSSGTCLVRRLIMCLISKVDAVDVAKFYMIVRLIIGRSFGSQTI